MVLDPMLVCRDQDKLQKRCPGNSCVSEGIFLGEYGFPWGVFNGVRAFNGVRPEVLAGH